MAVRYLVLHSRPHSLIDLQILGCGKNLIFYINVLVFINTFSIVSKDTEKAYVFRNLTYKKLITQKQTTQLKLIYFDI